MRPAMRRPVPAMRRVFGIAGRVACGLGRGHCDQKGEERVVLANKPAACAGLPEGNRPTARRSREQPPAIGTRFGENPAHCLHAALVLP
jgi:hypothetical protein